MGKNITAIISQIIEDRVSIGHAGRGIEITGIFTVDIVPIINPVGITIATLVGTGIVGDDGVLENNVTCGVSVNGAAAVRGVVVNNSDMGEGNATAIFYEKCATITKVGVGGAITAEGAIDEGARAGIIKSNDTIPSDTIVNDGNIFGMDRSRIDATIDASKVSPAVGNDDIG